MIQEAIRSSTNLSPLTLELRILAARFRSAIQASPTDREINNLKRTEGIQKAVMDELVAGVRSNDHLRTWDAAMWIKRLGIEIPDAQTRQDLPRLIVECEQALDAKGVAYKPRKRGVVRRRAMQFGGAAAAVTALAGVGKAAKFAYEVMNSRTQAVIKYDANAIFTGPSMADKYKGATQTKPIVEEPIEEPTAEVEPVLEPEESSEIIGNANMAEFFLGDLLNLFKYRRQERILFEPGAKERLIPALVGGDQITFLYLGLDETRERKIEFLGNGRGRSDVIMLVSFNPHTFKTIAISIPRDMYTPRLGANKINAMTAGVVGGDIRELSRTVVEELTGVPIDGIVQTNIDTMQGFNGIRSNQWGSEHPGIYYPGIFDVLAPGGLMINVPKQIIDNQYPVGYGIKRLVIPQGPQRMNGQQLTEYARTRHQEMDFGRSNNQRDVLLALVKVLASDAKDYLLSGDTGKLDLFISFLEREEQNGNIHYNEVNFTEIVRTIRSGLVKLRDDPQGKAILTTIALNSTDEIVTLLNNPQSVFSSFGLSFENGMLTNVGSTTQLRLAASPMGGSPIQYSQPLRRKVKELFGIP